MQLITVCILIVITVQVLTETCVTPNKEKAECIPIKDCPILFQSQKNPTLEIMNFIHQSRCGILNNETHQVCCGSASYLIKNETTTTNHKSNSKKKPLSDRRYCGYQHTDDYNYAGNDTAIDEFPWLAVFRYKKHDDVELDENDENDEPFEWGCAGSLINHRYILTAAQCLLFPKHSLVAIRLGEYNIRHETDCVKYSDLDDCSNPVEDVGIERKIRHPRYDRRKGLNDIALLRLNRTVTFSDYIRPICLPIPGIKLASVNDTVLITGFGKINLQEEYAIIKKRIVGKLISNSECEERFSIVFDKPRSVNENIVCSLQSKNSTVYTCDGDSGGPLMFSHRKQWHIEGISVWGSNVCGGLFPQAYTKVATYLNWIEETIQP